jgi:prepilin-type N-terminal cleavage/methylation domain-containing protein
MSERNFRQTNEGFSLVELSIVIVIIGFLIAGVAAGNNLIKQAQLRSVITDFQRYATSYNNFIAKYNALPGDMNVANTYWSTNCAASAALCNGDNSGIIDYASGSATSNEVNKAWKHMQLANMINSNIATVTAVDTVVGTNAPPSKIAGAGYILVGGSGATPFNSTNNAIFLGKATASATLTTAALTPEDAYGIDQKMDDANISGSNFIGATTGLVRAIDGNGVTASTCANAGTGAYSITTTTITCRLGMQLD